MARQMLIMLGKLPSVIPEARGGRLTQHNRQAMRLFLYVYFFGE
jgi:hypothetical protein